jgi:hypothetical protein
MECPEYLYNLGTKFNEGLIKIAKDFGFTKNHGHPFWHIIELLTTLQCNYIRNGVQSALKGGHSLLHIIIGSYLWHTQKQIYKRPGKFVMMHLNL